MENMTSSSTEKTLQRGRACLNCRRKKMRCDGVKPICGQCTASDRAFDCEYADSQGRTQTQTLEEQVARLETRIRELIDPLNTAPPVTLHDPYAAFREAQHRRDSSAGPPRGIRTLVQADAQSDVARLILFSARQSWWEQDEPPVEVQLILVKLFLPHARHLGFSLNLPRFLNALSAPMRESRPLPALMQTIFLWALQLAQVPQLSAHEPAFLARATALLAGSLGTAGTQGRLHAVQAEALLAQYFFARGRLLEGHYHASAGAALAVGCGLHQLRSPAPRPGGALLAGVGGVFDLEPPRDAAEEGERAGVFWAVFNVDRCWAVVVGAPVILSDDAALGTQIDTPWPLDADEYDAMDFDANATNSRTVQEFFAGHTGAQGQSIIALRAKASALFERASRFITRWKPATARGDALFEEYQTLARAISGFLASLPPLEGADNLASAARRTLVVTHSLAHVALIQLHHVRAGADRAAHEACVSATRAIIGIAGAFAGRGADFLDPAIVSAWMAASRVLAREMGRLRALPDSPAARAQADACAGVVARFGATLAEAVRAAPVLAFPVGKAQEILRTI